MARDRDLSAEMAKPKYVQFERERRWLVDTRARPALDSTDSLLIEDRYLDDCRFRVRRMSRVDGWCSHKLTKKYETTDPAIRPITTAYLTETEYALFRQLPGVDIAKRRFRLTVAGQVWSIDLFEGPLRGLELVETETADDEALHSLVPPPWAGREITHDMRYQCGSLARTQRIPEDRWQDS